LAWKLPDLGHSLNTCDEETIDRCITTD